MRRLVALSIVAAAALSASSAQAALILSQNDGASPVAYTNGGGNGFGGPLGSGTITMDASGSNLTVTFNNTGSLGSNIVTVYLDTVAGGFNDATMNDTGDPGRSVISNIARDGTESLPSMTNGLPDYAINFRGGGTELFGLGSTLTFIQSGATGSITLPLSSIGSPTTVDFIAILNSDTGFLSSEALPNAGLGGTNPGFAGGTSYVDYNQFAIPEPATLGVLAGAGVLALRRRK